LNVTIQYTDINKIALGVSSMQTKIRLEHVIPFGDGIFAFSITFMAVPIEIPSLSESLTQEQIIQGLVGELGPPIYYLCD
jgi:uncharacterized membrane protein